MLKNKPIRRRGEDLRDLPTYTIPEAASFLAISQRTLSSWYTGSQPVLLASGRYGDMYLLSYRDLEEAYRVHLLRGRYGFSFQKIRLALCNARTMFRSRHPLQRAEAVKNCFSDLVYDRPARGKTPRTITSLCEHPGQQFVTEVVDLFGERIVAGEFIYPWRFAAEDRQSRPVSMNPHIMSGRLMVSGTRIPVSTLAARKRSGSSFQEMASDYGLNVEGVCQALAHLRVRQKAA
jgi:uncharacterized protein (DUF433 family)